MTKTKEIKTQKKKTPIFQNFQSFQSVALAQKDRQVKFPKEIHTEEIHY